MVMRYFLFFLIFILGVGDCFAQSRMLENGLELYSLGDGFHSYNAVRLQKGKHWIKVLRAEDYGKRVMSASEVCTASGALMCINASFFDEKSNPLGLIVSSGILFQKVHQGGDTLNGIFSLSRKGFSIVDRQTFARQLAFEAVQAGPLILSAGKNLRESFDKNQSKRSAVCLNATGEPVFLISTDKTRASSLFELSEFMRKEPLNCIDGLNLDGGGSSQLFLKEKNTKAVSPENIALDLGGQDKVPLFLGVVEGMPF